MSAPAVALPEWVASEGRKRDDVHLGDRVRFEAILRTQHDTGADMGEWMASGLPRYDRPPFSGWKRVGDMIGQGIVVGIRFPYSGTLIQDEAGSTLFGDPPRPYTRKRERTHRAYLVACHMQHKPVHVLSDDVVLAPGIRTDDLAALHIQLPTPAERVASAAVDMWDIYDPFAAPDPDRNMIVHETLEKALVASGHLVMHPDHRVRRPNATGGDHG